VAPLAAPVGQHKPCPYVSLQALFDVSFYYDSSRSIPEGLRIMKTDM
jgi:hypothetical protein